VVVVGFLGQFSRAADSFSLLRLPLGGLTLVGTLFFLSKKSQAVLALIGITAVASVALHYAPQSVGNDIRIYSKNLWFGNTNTDALAADILQSDADAVFLQEVSQKNQSVLAQIRAKYPHQHLCPFSAWSGIAIASRVPLEGTPRCTNTRALAAAQITHDGQPLWLVSAHIPWPWPHNSADADQAAQDLLASLAGPKIIAGDFNIFPWSHRIGAIADITETKLAGPTQTTLVFKHLPLSIDHALAPAGGRIQTRPSLGGDHLGIIADLAITQGNEP
jgi:endonuclease/exonuclease/phosphatase (EEP) superfamily protein YafD